MKMYVQESVDEQSEGIGEPEGRGKRKRKLTGQTTLYFIRIYSPSKDHNPKIAILVTKF